MESRSILTYILITEYKICTPTLISSDAHWECLSQTWLLQCWMNAGACCGMTVWGIVLPRADIVVQSIIKSSLASAWLCQNAWPGVMRSTPQSLCSTTGVGTLDRKSEIKIMCFHNIHHTLHKYIGNQKSQLYKKTFIVRMLYSYWLLIVYYIWCI